MFSAEANSSNLPVAQSHLAFQFPMQPQLLSQPPLAHQPQPHQDQVCVPVSSGEALVSGSAFVLQDGADLPACSLSNLPPPLLQLDDFSTAERQHLYSVAAAADTGPEAATEGVREGTKHYLHLHLLHPNRTHRASLANAGAHTLRPDAVQHKLRSQSDLVLGAGGRDEQLHNAPELDYTLFHPSTTSLAIDESLNAAFALEQCAQLELLGDGAAVALVGGGGGHLLTRLGALASDSVSTSSDSSLSQLGAHSCACVPLGFACPDAAAFATPALTTVALASQYPTSSASYVLEPAATAVAPEAGYTEGLWADWHTAQMLAAAPASTSASTSKRQVLVHMSCPPANSLSLSVPTPAASICTRTFSSYTCPTRADLSQGISTGAGAGVGAGADNSAKSASLITSVAAGGMLPSGSSHCLQQTAASSSQQVHYAICRDTLSLSYS